MIGLLTGKILSKKPPHLVLDVQGVGYDIESSMTSFYQLPECEHPVTLHTHLWIREDAMRLYGFIDAEERDLFRCLLKVSGIGTKVALAILSNLDHNQLIASVQNQDAMTLVKVPGIGQKTAERLLLDLRDALKNWSSVSARPAQAHPTHSHASQEAISALIALGYKARDAERTVERLSQDYHECESLIRQALKEGVSA